jgi:hypothetical protein
VVRNSDGSLRILVDPPELYDVADPCVSWDASRIVFSGVIHPDSSWRIFEIATDGSSLRQITKSDRRIDLSQFGSTAHFLERYDDFDPCYLPDGRIIFASTRYPSIASFGRLLTSNLFVVNSDGTGLRRVTTERNGAEEPTIDPVTGRVVYSRWWVNRDLPSNQSRHGVTRDPRLALTGDVANVWHAITIRSDGEGLKLYAGFPRTRTGVQTYKPWVMDDGRLLSTYTTYASMTPRLGGTGIRWFKKGADVEHDIIGASPRRDAMRAVSPWAVDPVQLAGDTILFSYSESGTDFGIWISTVSGTNLERVVDLSGTHELEPQPLVPRQVPPILEEEFSYPAIDLPPTEDPRTYYQNETFRFDCLNLFANGAVDEPMPDAPTITVGAKIRFFMNVQRQSGDRPDPSIFLKEAEVKLNGGIHQHDVPADVPLFEQVVDNQGRVLEAPGGRFAHVTGMNFDRMGSGTKCVGCHAGHSMLQVPLNASVAEWFNVSTSAVATASSSTVLEGGMKSHPQSVVDRQARTGGDSTIWVSEEGEGAKIRLSWDFPIEAREFVLYAIPTNEASGTSLRVQDCEILLYYSTQLVGSVPSTGEIHEGGTRVSIRPTDIDSVSITIRRFDGTVHNRRVTGLAEIETIARISRLNYYLMRKG